ncbi:hypothetical protein SAMN05216321_10836 [Cupriavidus sp. OV038]|jgi:hypothetical protein|nr:hypothetical protein SAMN05216321_10836 [Cupriavidus sp. OV038]SFP53705.1 hypothetical protein SAMN05216322_10736 [Cupriavidus sp. OV096]
MKRETWVKAWAALAVSVALGACGGDGGNNGGNNGGNGAGSGGGNGGAGTPSMPETPSTPGNPETPATPQAVTYLGVISFGDTLAVTLDAPAAGQVRIRFSDSAFGLAGAVIGHYVKNGNVYTVSALEADSAEPPPAFVTALLGSVTASFTVSGTTLTGEISGLPKQLGNGKLSGQVTASSVSTPVTAADLAGTYTFLRGQSTYYASSGNLQIQYGMGGQMRVGADGTVRLCQAGTYSDTCSMGLAGTLALADQTRYPGAYTLTLGGKVWGQVFPLKTNGVTALYLDHLQLDSAGNRMTGTGVFRPAQTLTASQVAGQWVCRQPGVSYAAVTGLGISAALDGSMQEETLTISGTGSVTSAGTGQVASLALNRANNLLGVSSPAAIPGTMYADWTVPAVPPNTVTGLRTQVFMPLDENSMAYYAEVTSKPTDPRNWTFVVQGMCRKG